MAYLTYLYNLRKKKKFRYLIAHLARSNPKGRAQRRGRLSGGYKKRTDEKPFAFLGAWHFNVYETSGKIKVRKIDPRVSSIAVAFSNSSMSTLFFRLIECTSIRETSTREIISINTWDRDVSVSLRNVEIAWNLYFQSLFLAMSFIGKFRRVIQRPLSTASWRLD